jgi:hypothetical protein
MHLDDLIIIENELNIELPDNYKAAAIEAKISKTRFSTVFNDSPKKVVSMNKRLRGKGLHGRDWQEHHFVLGYDKDIRGGEYYFIDINKPNGSVYIANRNKRWRYNPDDVSMNEFYTNIDFFINQICLTHNMINEHDNAQSEPEINDKKEAAITNTFLDKMWADIEARKAQEKEE